MSRAHAASIHHSLLTNCPQSSFDFGLINLINQTSGRRKKNLRVSPVRLHAQGVSEIETPLPPCSAGLRMAA